MADLYLSGVVGFDITEQQVLDFLDTNDDKDINVYINSPGGSVFDGLGVYNILRGSGRNITTINNGLAASMGSILFLAGDKRVANTGSIYMVHKPSGLSWGNADDMKKEAEILDKIQDSLSAIYKERAGIDDIDDYINNETWWNVDDMIEKGIAHSEKKIQTNEGEPEDMAKIDDLKAEKEKLEAENATLSEQLAEAKLEKEIADMKAENEKLRAEATEPDPELEDEKDTIDGADDDDEGLDDSDSDDDPEPAAKSKAIDTTKAVAVNDKKNKIPEFMAKFQTNY